MRYLGVVADNIKDVYSVIRELKRLKVPFEILDTGSKVPRHVCALIVCSPRPCTGVGWAVAYNGDARNTVLRAISLSQRREMFDEVVVGVNPSESTGFATIADGELLEAYTLPGTDGREGTEAHTGCLPGKQVPSKDRHGEGFQGEPRFPRG